LSNTKNIVEDNLQVFRDIYHSPKPAAGIAVGYLSNNVPIELILAADLFPLRLQGDPNEETSAADEYMEPFFSGSIRSIFQRILADCYNNLDLIVIPRTSEESLQLYYYLMEVRRIEPRLNLPEIHLFDLLQTPGEATAHYNCDQVLNLKTRMEELAGRPISDQKISIAIGQTNKNWALLEQVNSLRRTVPPLISGQHLLEIIGASGLMPLSEHTAKLAELLNESESLSPIDGVRLMVKGQAHDNVGFYQLVEDLGAVIVADDHYLGERWFENPVSESADPLTALAERYHASPSIRSYPQSVQDQYFLKLVKTANVQGVIFYHEEGDDTLGWEYPDQKVLLEEIGIPSIYLHGQSYRTPDLAQQQKAVKSLIKVIGERHG